MMSAMDPPLHERVYEGLKEDYLAGHFVPGRRIDIQELATRHRSSKTPVREAAFIMVGEGLLTHHGDGGFLVPVLRPDQVILLLDLHKRLLIALLTTVKESVVRQALQPFVPLGIGTSALDIARRTTEIFSSIAATAGNDVASSHVRRLNERLHYSRILDAAGRLSAARELALFLNMEVESLHKATRRRVEAYHARKIDHQRRIMQGENPAL
ncbi:MULTISPECIES: GntR family transcriptional regulator [unclassified Novosphingobium]|uniref:GntR family transcriptional regulator n=1 Tax=unclassified Novosphingobium TaxID=2644732 RepID=UPI00146A22E6|nr:MULTISPECIES: GntR family transcriptional regulator [unclassified Novosphingobium]NMN88787.1 DNA-binding GntR family transcriptional regulator [Novosphingobium sp. SG916]